MKVLIVDDEPDIRDSLCEFFEEEGFSVSTASDGSEALRVLGLGDLPEIVILDLIMPKMNGSELLRRMRGDPRLAKVPVLVSTADPSRAPQGIPALKKPVDLDQLLSLVMRHATA